MTTLPATLETFFAWGQRLQTELGICGFLVGGSNIYRAAEQGKIQDARNVDAVLVVDKKWDIYSLLNDNVTPKANGAVGHIKSRIP